MPQLRFTDRSIQAIKPAPEGRVEYWDTTLPAFGLRVTTKGKMSWVLMYRVGGPVRRLTLGRYPAIGLADAREKARAALQLVDKGVDPSVERKAARDADSFAELAEEFLEKHAKQHNKRWWETERIINRELLPLWGRKKAAAIRRRDVIALLDDIAARGAPIMANGTLAVIRKMYNWAVSRDLVESSPCVGVRGPGKPTPN